MNVLWLVIWLLTAVDSLTERWQIRFKFTANQLLHRPHIKNCLEIREAGRTWPCKFGMKLKSAACLFRALYIVHWQYTQWVFVQFIFIRSGKKLLYWVLLARFSSMPILLWGGVEGITVIVVFKGLDFFFHLISFALKIFGFRFWCPLRFLCFPFFPSLYENLWEKSEADHEKSSQSN